MDREKEINKTIKVILKQKALIERRLVGVCCRLQMAYEFKRFLLNDKKLESENADSKLKK